MDQPPQIELRKVRKRLLRHKRYRMEIREYLLEHPGDEEAERWLVEEEAKVEILKSALKRAISTVR